MIKYYLGDYTYLKFLYYLANGEPIEIIYQDYPIESRELEVFCKGFSEYFSYINYKEIHNIDESISNKWIVGVELSMELEDRPKAISYLTDLLNKHIKPHPETRFWNIVCQSLILKMHNRLSIYDTGVGNKTTNKKTNLVEDENSTEEEIAEGYYKKALNVFTRGELNLDLLIDERIDDGDFSIVKEDVIREFGMNNDNDKNISTYIGRYNKKCLVINKVQRLGRRRGRTYPIITKKNFRKDFVTNDQNDYDD